MPVFPEKKREPPDGGNVRTTPGVRSMKSRAGMIMSAVVSVNLKTNLMIAQFRMASTIAWNRVCIK